MVVVFIKWIMTNLIIMLRLWNLKMTLPLIFQWKHLHLTMVVEPELWDL